MPPAGESLMPLKVVVWGTGNVGRPAISAVLSHSDLELVGCVVANPDKVGMDAGELAGVAPIGVIATDDGQALLQANMGRAGDVVVQQDDGGDLWWAFHGDAPPGAHAPRPARVAALCKSSSIRPSSAMGSV